MIELRRILKRVGVTALYVTHDQQEAFAVADRVVVMNAGLFEQIGTPQAVYARPATPFVARFLGLTNLLTVHNLTADGEVITALGRFRLEHPPVHAPACLLIRPEIEAQHLTAPGEAGSVQGRVSAVSFRGSDYHLELVATGQGDQAHTLDFILPTRHRGHLHVPAVGEAITIGIEPGQLLLL